MLVFKDIINSLNLSLKKFISRNIVYTKILQWVNFDILNIFGSDVNAYLKKFTDNAPYTDEDIDYEALYKLKTLGGKYEIEINEVPINSGTISLVFEGYIKDKKIAIKVLRNRIKDKINSCIATIRWVISLLNYLEYFRMLNLNKTIDDIEECILEQVDFEKEKESIKLFSRKLNNNKNIKTVKLIDELSFGGIIVMEFIEGKSVYKLNQEEKENYCRLLMTTVFYIQLKKGLYHMDLHPGNILYTSDSKLAYLDLGMIETLSPQESNFLIDYLEVIVSNDDIAKLLNDIVSKYRDVLFEPGDLNTNFINCILDKHPDLYKSKNALNQVQDTQLFLGNLHLAKCKVTKRLNRILFGLVSFLNLFTLFDLQIQGLLIEKIQNFKYIKNE